MIHKYKMNHYNIVLDVNSGAIHVVDDLTYRILDIYKYETEERIIQLLKGKYEEHLISEVIAEIKQLEEKGVLFSEDQFHEVAENLPNRNPVVKALCLHIAHDCNLKCKYCFAEEGEYGGNRMLMSAETGKKAIDFLIEKSTNRRNLEIDFFGGEPLMNFDAVKEIEKLLLLEMGLKKEINLMLLDKGPSCGYSDMKQGTVRLYNGWVQNI